jgi:hypothetical protein
VLEVAPDRATESLSVSSPHLPDRLLDAAFDERGPGWFVGSPHLTDGLLGGLPYTALDECASNCALLDLQRGPQPCRGGPQLALHAGARAQRPREPLGAPHPFGVRALDPLHGPPPSYRRDGGVANAPVLGT